MFLLKEYYDKGRGYCKGDKNIWEGPLEVKIHSYLYSNFSRGLLSDIHPDWKGKKVWRKNTNCNGKERNLCID